MKSFTRFFKNIYSELIFLSLLFLVFFQVLNTFITNVFALNFILFGIGPYTILVVFFLSPPILLFFKKKFHISGIYVTISLILIARILMVFITDIVALAFITGVGVAASFIFLPAYLVRKRESNGTPNFLTLTQGLTIAIGLSIALKAIGHSYDLSIFGLGRIITGVIVAIIILMLPGLYYQETEQVTSEPLEEEDKALEIDEEEIEKEAPLPEKPGFGKVFLLSLGIFGVILIEWFALAFPAAFARWSDSSYQIVTIITLATNALFLILITVLPKILNNLKIWVVVVLNVLLVASIILVSALPMPGASLVQQIFTYITAALSPVALLDFMLLTKMLNKQKPTTRQLGGAFGISSVILLIVTFLNISAFNYEWVPLMGFLKGRYYIIIILVVIMILIPIIYIVARKGFVVRAFKKLPKRTHIKNQVAAYALIGLVLAVAGVGLGLNIIKPDTPASPTTLKVMTYNVHIGEDKNGTSNLLRLVESIRLADPDVIGLQESDMARIAFSNVDLVRFLAEQLNMYYYYGPKTVSGVYGVATLSKFPIEFAETYFMPSGTHSHRVITRTDLRIGADLIPFYNTHFGLNLTTEREPQAQFVADLLSGATDTFVVGDFNTKDDESAYPIFMVGFTDSWLDINPSGLNGTGFNGDTNRFPRRRIDYILFNGFTCNSVEVLTWADESDHWPVFGVYTL
ncbi:MAG: endonuclease/exonuclease/phosphatase family protein [Candidatus Heimdallarchaeota archaeon]|nr:endonuclease/exonuclease/phosphatase family protein [Candidatus Heimdallarchaeota archaeon]MBY8995841.1 endonuclease/exonuclease/phosphatase family protein [Candidatus Heimdallarchaeota archaeon]